MSKINLPPLPPVPGEIIVDEDCEGGAVYGQDKDALCAWATAYAEQAVRQALAAQVPVAACLLGYGPTILTTDTERIHDGWKGLAVIPENDHGEST